MKARLWSTLILSAMAATGVAHARELCRTIEDCLSLKFRVEARLRALGHGQLPRLSDILRNPDGSVRYMNHIDAERACREQGSRLPTARELAVYSQSLGARGIREPARPGLVRGDSTVQTEIAQMRRDGYSPIYFVNALGDTSVDFYFSISGYQPPAGDLVNNWFWSSSIYPLGPYHAYGLNGDDGFIGVVNRSYGLDNSAVRCVL